MTIKLSFLEGLARLAPTDYSQRAGAVTFIGPTVVTCLEIRSPLQPAEGRAVGYGM